MSSEPQTTEEIEEADERPSTESLRLQISYGELLCAQSNYVRRALLDLYGERFNTTEAHPEELASFKSGHKALTRIFNLMGREPA